MMRIPLKALVYVEGETDIPIVRAVMRAAGWSGGEFEVFALGGAANLEKRLRQQVAQESPIPRIFIMDSDGKCPVELRRRLMAQGSAATVALRICHYEIESWILADDQGFSRFFTIPLAKVVSPDGGNAKERMLRCVDRLGRSNTQDFARRTARNDGYGFGSRYTILLRRFVDDEWRAERAAPRSNSLSRALLRLRELHERFARAG
jgi:hypothetical protein